MRVRVPPVAEILKRWNDIESLLRRATSRTEGCYEPEDVLAMVCANRLTILLIEDDYDELRVVAVTEVRDYPRRRVLDVSFIGGREGNDTGITEWVPALVEHLEKMARACGATLLSGSGRIGWARVAKFKLIGGYMTRGLSNAGR